MIFDKITLDVELIRGKYGFRLLEELYCFDKETGIHLLIPPGFRTDFASVPPIFRPFISNADTRVRLPSVAHDWMYAKRGKMSEFIYNGSQGRVIVGPTRISRVAADKCFYNGLRLQGVSKIKALAMWLAVRVGGWRRWDG